MQRSKYSQGSAHGQKTKDCALSKCIANGAAKSTYATKADALSQFCFFLEYSCLLFDCSDLHIT